MCFILNQSHVVVNCHIAVNGPRTNPPARKQQKATSTTSTTVAQTAGHNGQMNEAASEPITSSSEYSTDLSSVADDANSTEEIISASTATPSKVCIVMGEHD